MLEDVVVEQEDSVGTKAAVSFTLAVVAGLQEHVPLKFEDVPEVSFETQPEILFPLAQKLNLPATLEVRETETETPFLVEDERVSTQRGRFGHISNRDIEVASTGSISC